MAARTTTHLVKCPQLVCAGCGGEAVKAHYGAQTVEVEPCQSLRAQGWQGDVAVALWHNQALQLLVPAQPAAVRHAEGLVVFA